VWRNVPRAPTIIYNESRMDEKEFSDLMDSIKEAGESKRGERKPSRVFEYDFSQGKRGAVEPLPAGKTRITIRLDNKVLDWFRDTVDKAGGGNYQTLINNVLLDYVRDQQDREPLEALLRRVLREELAANG